MCNKHKDDWYPAESKIEDSAVIYSILGAKQAKWLYYFLISALHLTSRPRFALGSPARRSSPAGLVTFQIASLANQTHWLWIAKLLASEGAQKATCDCAARAPREKAMTSAYANIAGTPDGSESSSATHFFDLFGRQLN
jgi:hypothetical protein